MRTRALRDGLRTTEVGLGAAQFGNLFEATTDEVSTAAVAAAWDAGVRYFDTAPHYGLGLSERRLGRALAGRPRDAYVLSTKVGRVLEPTPERAGERDDEFLVPATHRRVFDFSRDGILRSFEASLERLGTDRVDIVYLHDPDEHWDSASTTGVGALVELREQGVVGAVGAGMNQSAMLTRFVERTDVDVVMVAGRLTLLDAAATRDLLPAAAARGVAVVAAAVYNSGILSAPVVPDDAVFQYGPADPELVDRARRIARVCARYGVTLPDVSVQYPLRWSQVVSVVLGTRTPAHATSGVERAEVEIPQSLWNELVEEGLLVTAG